MLQSVWVPVEIYTLLKYTLHIGPKKLEFSAGFVGSASLAVLGNLPIFCVGETWRQLGACGIVWSAGDTYMGFHSLATRLYVCHDQGGKP